MIEKLICDGEEQYLEETNHYGNVVKGWDGFLTSRPRPVHASSHHGSKRSNVTVKERIFSVSSSSAPIDNPLDHPAPLTIGAVGAGAGGPGEVSMDSEMELMGAAAGASGAPPTAFRPSKANPNPGNANANMRQAKEEGNASD